jgi:hypothetical protein
MKNPTGAVSTHGNRAFVGLERRAERIWRAFACWHCLPWRLVF